MKEWIEMADGTALDNTFMLALDEKKVAIHAMGQRTFNEIYKIFGNKKKTETIKSYQYGEYHVWEGYTELTAVEIRDDRAVINLHKM